MPSRAVGNGLGSRDAPVPDGDPYPAFRDHRRCHNTSICTLAISRACAHALIPAICELRITLTAAAVLGARNGGTVPRRSDSPGRSAPAVKNRPGPVGSFPPCPGEGLAQPVTSHHAAAFALSNRAAFSARNTRAVISPFFLHQPASYVAGQQSTWCSECAAGEINHVRQPSAGQSREILNTWRVIPPDTPVRG